MYHLHFQPKENQWTLCCPTLILSTTTQPAEIQPWNHKTTQKKSKKHPSSLTTNQRETRTHRYTSSWVKKKQNLHHQSLHLTLDLQSCAVLLKNKTKDNKGNHTQTRAKLQPIILPGERKEKGKPQNCIKLSVWSPPPPLSISSGLLPTLANWV
jgi:hypothetical protein